MFHVYKNGICISGVCDAIYTDDPASAYRRMMLRFRSNRYFIYRLHPDWAKAYSLKNGCFHIDMGKPYEQAVTAIADKDVSADCTELTEEDEDEFYDPLDHPDRERHLQCDDHPNDHFGE